MEMCTYMFYGRFYMQDRLFFLHIFMYLSLTKNVKVDIEKILQQSVDNDDVSMSLSFGDGDDIMV